jgi:hypothetical protein
VSNKAEDRILSVVQTIANTVSGHIITIDDLKSDVMADCVLTVLTGRTWSDEDKAAVNEMIKRYSEKTQPKNQPSLYTAPCDTHLEGFSFDDRSVVCRRCDHKDECSKGFAANRVTVRKTRVKKDPLKNPTPMNYILLRVVKDPLLTREDIIAGLKENYAEIPAVVSIDQQHNETLKHLRIFNRLGYLDEVYASSLPAAKRDVFAKMSSVTTMAIESAIIGWEENGDFDKVMERAAKLGITVARDSIYYQYMDSTKVRQAAINLGVYKVKG